MASDPRYKTVPRPPSYFDKCRRYIKKILEIAEDYDDSSGNDFTEMLAEYQGNGGNTTRRLINFFKRSGMLSASANSINANPELLNLEKDSEEFRACVINKISEQTLGFYDILFELFATDLIIEDLHKILINRYDVNWSSKRQVKNRVDWLRGLGYVSMRPNSRHYQLTRLGEQYVVDKCHQRLIHPRQIVNNFGSYAIEVVETTTELPSPLSEGQLWTTKQPGDELSIKSRDNHLVVLSTPDVFYGYGEFRKGQSDGQSPRELRYRHFDNRVSTTMYQINGLELESPKDVLSAGSYTFKNAFNNSGDYERLISPNTAREDPKNKISPPDGDPFPELGRTSDSSSTESAQKETIREENRTYAEWTPSVTPFERDITAAEVDTSGLHFRDEERLLTQIVSTLATGDHIVLVGPPGTGKSALARRISAAFVEDQFEMVTATADWSTFNTIGGYQFDQSNDLRFHPGVFLRRFQNAKQNPKLEWLIVDELNRADIDKAFGSLFSAIVGDSVHTPFTNDDGEPIEILGPSKDEKQIRDSRYYIPDDWRMIATMNTYDKTSLYEMSFAFMRRFAFIYVEPPYSDDVSEELIKKYANEWNLDASEYNEQLASIWETIQPTRRLGPAVFERVLRYANTHPEDNLTEPIIMYVLPQLEGLATTRQIEIIHSILDDDKLEMYLNETQLTRFAADYFGISLDRFIRE